MNESFRVEHDFLGEKEIPAHAYWGIHTARALENFPISGTSLSAMPELIRASGYVKRAAASANLRLGVLDARRAGAIEAACDALVTGSFHEQFVVDVVQGGAGTSTNMNANEVIANVALNTLGHRPGEYQVLHPNDHVNASQSTNDVYPTALRIALWACIKDLLRSMEGLRHAFEEKALDFADVMKIGRTQLQDAVPMTLGQEISTYASMLKEDEQRLRDARALMEEVNLGATAIGTGINAPAGYGALACSLLAEISGVPVRKAHNLVHATQDTGAFLELSGVLKKAAVRLSKTCNDLRLLGSGPQAGFADVLLPPRQAGSSIMPGKVNPVIPEVVNQVAFEVIGNDLTITMACEAGQLQLNAFEPIIGWSLYKSIRHLGTACDTLSVNCVQGLQPNRRLLARRVDESVTIVTALNPVIGYERAALIAKAALTTGESFRQVVRSLGVLDERQIEELLTLEKLTRATAVPP